MTTRRRIIAALCLSLLLVLPARAELGFVGCSTPDDAYSFDLDSYAVGPVIDLLPEGNYPYDATISPNGLEVWIPGASGDGVIVLSRATGAIIARVDTGEYPVSVAFTDDGTRALVSCRDSDRVDVVSTNTYQIVSSLPIPSNYLGPGNIALDPTTGNFYLVEWYDDTLYEIDPDGTSILRQVSIGDSMWQLVVDPGGDYVYVTDRGMDRLLMIDKATLSLSAAWVTGDDPWGVDVTLDGSQVVVCSEDTGSLTFFDTSNWAMSFYVPLGPNYDFRDLDILDAAGKVFVTSGDITGTDQVLVFELDDPLFYEFIEIPGSNTNVVAVQAQVWSGAVTAADPAPGALTSLELYPNPFNPAATARFSLASAGELTLTVHDSSGRLLRTLDAGFRAAGEHELVWDGRDEAGRALPSGIYHLRLATAADSRSLKAVLLK